MALILVLSDLIECCKRGRVNSGVGWLIEIGALGLGKSLMEVAVKKCRVFISTLTLLAMASLSCAQTAKKKEAESPFAARPQPLWQYDTGG
jgi:hypothetical protein